MFTYQCKAIATIAIIVLSTVQYPNAGDNTKKSTPASDINKTSKKTANNSLEKIYSDKLKRIVSSCNKGKHVAFEKAFISLITKIWLPEKLLPDKKHSNKRHLTAAIKAFFVYGPAESALTVHNRNDFAQHFIVGSGMGLIIDDKIAFEIAKAKEELDATEGQSGFDYNDLAVTFFGIRLGATCRYFTESEAGEFMDKIITQKITFDMLCPKPDLPHLKTGILPTKKQEEQAIKAINLASRKINTQLLAMLINAKTGSATKAQ
jgi:hypothetical protein